VILPAHKRPRRPGVRIARRGRGPQALSKLGEHAEARRPLAKALELAGLLQTRAVCHSSLSCGAPIGILRIKENEEGRMTEGPRARGRASTRGPLRHSPSPVSERVVRSAQEMQVALRRRLQNRLKLARPRDQLPCTWIFWADVTPFSLVLV
jgi:hypothetical protein